MAGPITMAIKGPLFQTRALIVLINHVVDDFLRETPSKIAGVGLYNVL